VLGVEYHSSGTAGQDRVIAGGVGQAHRQQIQQHPITVRVIAVAGVENRVWRLSTQYGHHAVVGVKP